MIKLAKLILLCGTGLLIMAGCTSEGNGSGVGTGMVTGKLYEPDGTTPAKGATVVVRHRNTTAMVSGAGTAKTAGALYTTLTDVSGNFSFDTIVEGEFVIEGSDNAGNMALYDSVDIDQSIDKLDLPSDTLEPSGVLTGKIELSQGGNFMQVFVLAFGVDRFCQVKSDGTFTFEGFAEGTYKIKILSLDPGYLSFDTTGVVIESGDTTDLGTIRLQSKVKLPVPQNLTVAYDTAQMIATLSWEATPEGVTAGYNVYRIAIDQIYEATDGITTWLDTQKVSLSKRLIKETVCMDTTLYLDYYNERIPDHVQYVVTMVDTNGNESGASVWEEIAVVNSWVAVDSFTFATSMMRVADYKFDRKNNLWLLSANGSLECYSSRGELRCKVQFTGEPDFALISSCDEDGGVGVVKRFLSYDPFGVEKRWYYYVTSSGDTSMMREWSTDTRENSNPPTIGMVEYGKLYGMFTNNTIQMLNVLDDTLTTLYENNDTTCHITEIVPAIGNKFALIMDRTLGSWGANNPRQYEFVVMIYGDALPMIQHVLSPVKIPDWSMGMVLVSNSGIYSVSDCYQLLSDGTVQKSKMPIVRNENRNGLMARADGTLVNLSGFYEEQLTVTTYTMKK